MSMNSLKDHHALVTGGGTGIGAAIARALNDAGARVTICGRRREPLEEVCGKRDNMAAEVCDVTKEDQVKALFQSSAERSGPVDIVIANAGAARSAPATHTGLDLWQDMLDINLTGTFLTLREGLRGMKDQPYGRLIAIASTAGLTGYRYVSAYTAAKHGVIGLVRALALETSGSGITANAVCPGFTETPMLEDTVRNITGKTGANAEKARHSIEQMNPGGRLIRPEEIADTILWLTGENAGAVTGQAITVAGGAV